VIGGGGNVYVVGGTLSEDFPVTQNGYENKYKGLEDGYVIELTGDLSRVIAGTYIGGSDEDWASGIAIGGGGNVYVVGGTLSEDFPVRDGYDGSYNGLGDGYVIELTGDLSEGESYDTTGLKDGNLKGIGTSLSGVYSSGYSKSSDELYKEYLVATPANGKVPLKVHFVCKLDVGKKVTKFQWDFNGDGKIDQVTSTGEVTHVYTQPGIYEVRCIVGDESVLGVMVNVYEDLKNIAICEFKGASYFCKVPVKDGFGNVVNVIFEFKKGTKVYKKVCKKLSNEEVCYEVPQVSNIKAVYLQNFSESEIINEVESDIISINEFLVNGDEFTLNFLKTLKDELVVGAFLKWYLYTKYKRFFDKESVREVSDKFDNEDTYLLEVAMLRGLREDPYSERFKSFYFFIRDVLLNKVESEITTQNIVDLIKVLRDCLTLTSNALGWNYSQNEKYIKVNDYEVFQTLKDLETKVRPVLSMQELAKFYVDLEFLTNTIPYRLDLLKQVFKYNNMNQSLEKVQNLMENYEEGSLLEKTLSRVLTYLEDKLPENLMYLSLYDLVVKELEWQTFLDFNLVLTPSDNLSKVCIARGDQAVLEVLGKAVENYIKHEFSKWEFIPPTIGEVSDVLELLKMEEYIEFLKGVIDKKEYTNLIAQILDVSHKMLSFNSLQKLQTGAKFVNVVERKLEEKYFHSFTFDPSDLKKFLNDESCVKLLSTLPKSGSNGLPNKPIIKFVFSESIDEGSLKGNVFLENPFKYIIPSYVFTFDKDVFVIPKNPLSFGITYSAVVNKVKDIWGNPISERDTLSFTVGNSTSELVGGLDYDVSGLTVTFYPSAQNGNSYKFFIEFGDGDFVNLSIGAPITHTYSSPGNYTVKLSVVDAETNKQVIVTKSVEVKSPKMLDVSCTSFLIANSTEGHPPLKVNFICKNDLEENVKRYEWDFNGDGIIDQTTDINTVTHTYSTTGTFYATCKVISNDGWQGTSDPVTITVGVSKSSEDYIGGNSTGGGGCSVDPNAPFMLDLLMLFGVPILYLLTRSKKFPF